MAFDALTELFACFDFLEFLEQLNIQLGIVFGIIVRVDFVGFFGPFFEFRDTLLAYPFLDRLHPVENSLHLLIPRIDTHLNLSLSYIFVKYMKPLNDE